MRRDKCLRKGVSRDKQVWVDTRQMKTLGQDQARALGAQSTQAAAITDRGRTAELPEAYFQVRRALEAEANDPVRLARP